MMRVYAMHTYQQVPACFRSLEPDLTILRSTDLTDVRYLPWIVVMYYIARRTKLLYFRIIREINKSKEKKTSRDTTEREEVS